jgi:stage V sporulation protein SpoVS
MGFASTVRKAYDDPHSENLKTFLIQTVKLCIAMAIVVDHNFVTIYSIGTGLAFNAVTSALIIGRRYQLAEKPEVVLTPAYT